MSAGRPSSWQLVALLLLPQGCSGGDPAGSGRDAGAERDAEGGRDASRGEDAGGGATALSVFVSPPIAPPIRAFVRFLERDDVRVVETSDPEGAATSASDGIAVAALLNDASCIECYRFDRVGQGIVLVGGSALAVQYGLAHLLESLGVRFFSPWASMAPASLPSTPELPWGETIAPETRVRGMQLHTLHPIEAHFAFWLPSPEHLEDARRILDWEVKNRANLVTWVPLDDIATDPEVFDAWQAHTAAIVEEAHLRGLRVGINVQLFARANLQHAYDLFEEDADPETQRDAARARIERILGALPFDLVTLSFGEFFESDPDAFIAALDLATLLIEEVRPETEVTAVVHVGDQPDLRVEYQGEEMLYYFLVQFADPRIVPWVHTVMYFDLFDDAGGAYSHEDFGEHREFLLERLVAGERAAYFPETAYWIAFDDSVPLFLPLYVRSRWRDLAGIHETAHLDEHVLFSTGWEWGYWLNDWAALRMSFRLEDWRESIRFAFAPMGGRGASLADQVVALAELQHEALIEDRLAAYLAGRDAIIDLGDDYGIVSQPDRLRFDEIASLDADQRASFVTSVVDRLDDLAASTRSILDQLPVEVDPWGAEVADGIEIDWLRARFAAALHRAVAEDEPALLGEAAETLGAARAVVARRHAALRDPSPARILESAPNATIYDFGYLMMADTLCYWEREAIQAENALLGADRDVPRCTGL